MGKGSKENRTKRSCNVSNFRQPTICFRRVGRWKVRLTFEAESEHGGAERQNDEMDNGTTKVQNNKKLLG